MLKGHVDFVEKGGGVLVLVLARRAARIDVYRSGLDFYRRSVMVTVWQNEVGEFRFPRLSVLLAGLGRGHILLIEEKGGLGGEGGPVRRGSFICCLAAVWVCVACFGVIFRQVITHTAHTLIYWGDVDVLRCTKGWAYQV